MVVKSMSVFGSMKCMAAVAAHWGVPVSEKEHILIQDFGTPSHEQNQII